MDGPHPHCGHALKNGATPNLDRMLTSGNTCLHMALSLRREDAVKLLLEHGADPNAINGDGKSVLEFAIIKDMVPLPNEAKKPAVPFHTTLLKYGAKATLADFSVIAMFGDLGMALRLRAHRSFSTNDKAVAVAQVAETTDASVPL